MEMESRHLVVMFIALVAGLTSFECFHSTLRQLDSTLVAWYVTQTRLIRYMFLGTPTEL